MNILITGANSGLGRALAEAYGAKNIRLFLVARNIEKLQEVKKLCENLGSKVEIAKIDVTCHASISKWIRDIDKKYRLDLVIANAGISAGSDGGAEDFNQVNRIFSTNLNGVLNTIHPVIKNFIDRKSGQIVIISSLAGFRGLPSCPAYSASKAAVRLYGQALRGSLMKFGIKVNVVCPGYIKTPMTDVNDFPMPFIMSSKKAATIIKRGISINKPLIAFPFIFYALIYFLSILPNRLTDVIFSKLPSKKSINNQ